MLLWRLSGTRYAHALDDGYGLHFDGRWNTIGHPITYCATSPSLCVLEKLVHIEDPALLPPLTMVTYETPDDAEIEIVTLDALPEDWRLREGLTQQIGDNWHQGRSSLLLRVPSAIVPVANSPDLNVLVNHAHLDAAAIKVVTAEPFVLDPRLFGAAVVPPTVE
ncbi:RES family NAD+ phosphorylase [Rhizobium mongolense]|uniref:RES domain-containing protein n=2 Tax=Rhizobium mongolense TaxID=57676 RepID=A0ABR6IFS7_9HYPH|nr:RES family NAD+ phosphorylase [Rhizobium mongolense]MBB4226731.1 RES domain-containing protein [Rhizobium mongolense]TVZ73961.1 RES domain-containing protein [Rhizobium mongolense USDA 1844]